MMKAIKNFMKKPITWGDSFKWSGIVLGKCSSHRDNCCLREVDRL